MSDPRLEAEARNNNPATAWNTPAPKSTDGLQISTYSGAASISSTSAVADAQNAAAGAPYDYALDARTQCRIGPNDLKEDSIVYFGGNGVTVAQARDLGWLPRAQVQQQQEQPRPFDRSAATNQPQDVPDDLKAKCLPIPRQSRL